MCGSTAENKVVAELKIDAAGLTEFAFASRKYPEYMHPQMVECAECQLVYGNLVPARETVIGAYEKAAFDSGQESLFASRTYARIVAGQLKQLGSHKTALDIGAGDGRFLESLLALGFSEVIGVEPSAAAVAQADRKAQGLIRQGLFRAEDFEPGAFDQITCFQVMEHLWGPTQMASDAFALLRPGGLFLTVVHDVEALPTRLLGTRSPIFDIEHLQLFSRATIASLLQRSGFTGTLVTPLWNRYPIYYWLKLAPFPLAAKKALIDCSKRIRLGRIPCSLRAGNLVAVGWKPS